jgi:hypothetical protein
MQKRRQIALLASAVVVAGLTVLVLLLGNPADAYRAYRVADGFVARLAAGRYDELPSLSSAGLARVMRDRPQAVRRDYPAIRAYSLKNIGRSPGGLVWLITFRIDTEGADELRVEVEEEGGRFVVSLLE